MKEINQKYDQPDVDKTSLAHNERLLKSLAYKGFMRCQAAGICAVSEEDVHQEMLVSYLKVKKTFNPNNGARFSTYLVSACWKNFNRWLEPMEFESKTGVFQSGAMEDVFGTSYSLDERIPDEQAFLPEESLWHKQAIGLVEKQLHPFAKQALGLLLDPPQEMLDYYWCDRQQPHNLNSAKPDLRFVVGYLLRGSNADKSQLTNMRKHVRQQFELATAMLEAI